MASGQTPSQRLEALYEGWGHPKLSGVPSACALAKAGISVSTHGRVRFKDGKVTRGTRHGAGWRVMIDGKRQCVGKLTRRVWLNPPRDTHLKYELWPYDFLPEKHEDEQRSEPAEILRTKQADRQSS